MAAPLVLSQTGGRFHRQLLHVDESSPQVRTCICCLTANITIEVSTLTPTQLSTVAELTHTGGCFLAVHLPFYKCHRITANQQTQPHLILLMMRGGLALHPASWYDHRIALFWMVHPISCYYIRVQCIRSVLKFQ
jgi:hypothetical protein